jgi:hypothetical protein
MVSQGVKHEIREVKAKSAGKIKRDGDVLIETYPIYCDFIA